LVAEGTYFENINFFGAAITVASNFLIDGDPLHIENTIINGSQPINPDHGSVVTFMNGEDTTSVITGFTLTEGTGRYYPSGTIGGGIIISLNSSPSIISNIIKENSANGSGALGCYNDSNPRIINNVFTDNVGFFSHGGLAIINSCAYLEGNIIKNNFGGAANGVGGIGIYGSSVTFINNIIVDNYTDGGAGGIFIGQDISSVFVNCIISGNIADMTGGGIYIQNNSEATLVNCILWDNFPDEIYGSANITYSDIEGSWAGIGNIDEDPLFVGPGEHPYALSRFSPCIDAGNPDPIYYDPEDPGNPGYALYPAMGTIINDMGAYGGPNAIGWSFVGLDDNVIVQTPEVFLHQNYPNPFNPETTISFQFSNEQNQQNEQTKLEIYNVKGQKVKSFNSAQFVILSGVEGQSSIQWNGTDEYGKPAPSGIYFYKLRAGNFQKVKKMILMK
jgi:parallel beta-helix repeat protein